MKDFASLHVQGVVWAMGRLVLTGDALVWRPILPWFSNITRRVMRIPIPDSVTVELSQVTGCDLGQRGEWTILPILMPFKRALIVRTEDQAYRWYIGMYWWADPSKRWLTLLRQRLAELGGRG